MKTEGGHQKKKGNLMGRKKLKNGNFKKEGGCYNFTPVVVIKCFVTKSKKQEGDRW